MIDPFVLEQWADLADADRESPEAMEWEACWADASDGVACGVATTDPSGLCDRHRRRLRR